MAINYPETRKSPVRLTPDEEYGIYKYCVENHCLAQNEDLFNFRVEPGIVAKEINKHFPRITNNRDINSHHVKVAVENVVGWQRRLGKLPVVPIETAELEQLREGKLRMVKEIEEFKLLVERYKTALDANAKEIERLKKPSDAHQKLERIRAIVSI